MRRVLVALAAVVCVAPALVTRAAPVTVRAAVSAPSWLQLDSQPQKRAGGTATVMDSGKVLIAGGDLLSTEIFDPATGAFSAGPQQLHLQAGATATRLNTPNRPNKVVLVGGRDATGTATDEVEVYDPAANSWSEPATNSSSGQAPQAARLGTARWGHTATLLPDGKSVLVAGGVDTSNLPLSTAEIFDSSVPAWTNTLTPMSTARTLHAAAQLPDGRVLVTGGQTAPNPVTKQQYTASSEIYDPSVGHWQPAGPLSFARSQLTLTPIGSSLLAVGGLTCTPVLLPTTTCSDAVSAAVDIFNTSTNVWSAAAGLDVPRFGHTAVPLDAGVMVVGGHTSTRDSSVTGSVAIFNQASGWQLPLPSSLNIARTGAPLAVIPGPQSTCKPEVLVVGGTDQTGASLGSAELYRAQPWITALAPTRGPAGGATTVTVTGGALDTVTSAQIGSRSVSFNVSSASFVAPPEKAADGAIQQVSVASATCTARGSLAFSYDPPAVSQVTRPFGPATVVPNARSVQVSGSSFAGVNQVTFGGHVAPILATNPDGTVTVQPPAHVASEPLTVDVSVRAGEVVSQVSGSYTYVEPPVIGAVNPSSVSTRDLTLAISGHGFQHIGDEPTTDGVTIGGLPAGQPAIAGDTDMVVTLPSGLKPGPQDVVVTALGMVSKAFPVTILPPPSEAAPPPPPGGDSGAGSQPPQPPPAPAGPGGGTSTAVETIPSSATLQSTASLGQGYVITPAHASAPGFGQLPGLLQLPGYAPVGAPGSTLPGAAPATVAEGAPGMAQGSNPAANVVGDEGSGGRARYGMVRASDPGAWLAGAIVLAAIVSLVVTWAPRLRGGQAWAPGYADL